MGEAAEAGALRFVCISDTHNRHESLPPLPPGDVLVHTGDFTNFGVAAEVEGFATWFATQPHRHKLLVPGNHDMIIDRGFYDEFWGDLTPVKEDAAHALEALTSRGIRVLIDETVELPGGVRVHGSPWVTRGPKDHSTAFMKLDGEMGEHWRGKTAAGVTRGSVDVLLTHMPPCGYGDRTATGKSTGCPHLARWVETELMPAWHVFGHIHSDPGLWRAGETNFLNAACVTDFYRVRTGGLCFTCGPSSVAAAATVPFGPQDPFLGSRPL
eukprot:NODE_2865_length_863_cov_104.242574.p1 GENE.NODE_2865_length_863_cov_104.242574~~NODE_2865_length_863_cov_104.242574.p1  ORF type:complete len:269 (-),score=72.70 NODE_2865_length_863_cov_104.242574:39-845(-)